MTAPLNIELQNLGKKFYGRWLFREINHDFSGDSQLALIGKNGSGKSTLLRIIAGQMTPSEGNLIYSRNGQRLPASQIYQTISWSGPQIELYLDLSLQEHIDLHFRFRRCTLEKPSELIEILRLQAHADKALRYYSSGMLQRVKVGLALFTESQVLMLDEPTSHMDEENARIMLELIHHHQQNRLFVLASNLEREYQHIPQQLYLG